MIHVHRLDGCAPAPLAHYLKALGILRLVAEQADRGARGWWDGDRFRLATKLSGGELDTFFLDDYRPTPLVSPWNKGSGFFFEKDPAVFPLEKSKSRRFLDFREGIRASRQQIEELERADGEVRDIKNEAKKRKKNELDKARSRVGFEDDYEALVRDWRKARELAKDSTYQNRDKVVRQLGRAKELVGEAEDYKVLLDERDEAEQLGDPVLQNVLQRLRASNNYKRRLGGAERRFRRLKADLIPGLRLHWRGAHREWMDAAMVLGDDGTPKYPALLGTGGNDGRLDFTNNFMKRLGEIFHLDSDDGKPRSTAFAWVRGALWGRPVPGNLSGQPVGQFLPGTAGGANNANGADSDSLVNPMDFILMLEGTIAFASSASRRLGSSESSRAATPFVVNACGAAYPSASADDESARGEQWMPLWSRPSTYQELRQLLAEGRAQVGTKAAREPLDLARAVRGLGVARGIGAFQRYGYVERNGQSNLAVPLGRFDVAKRASEQLSCIDDLDVWLRRLRREARDRNAPVRLATAEQRLVNALFAVTERPQSPECWQGVLSRLTEAEGVMACGTGFAAGPVPRLRPEWVAASYDGTAEFRLALAFALQAAGFHREAGTPVDPIRRHWLPLDRELPWRFAKTGEGSSALDMQPDVVMHGRRGIDDANALIARRMVEASQREGRRLPLMAARYAAACIADLTALLAGGVDLDRMLILACALMALDRRSWAEQRIPIETPRASDWPDDPWLAIRLCTLPWPFKTRSGFELDIGTDPALIRRLAAGDAATAFALASRRLGAAGVRCPVRSGMAGPDTARLWAAALAFPITQRTARRLLYRLDPTKE